MEKLAYVESIKCTWRACPTPGNLKGWCNVEVNLRDDSRIEIESVGIIYRPGKAPFVAFPQRKNGDKFFDVIRAKGPLGDAIRAFVLAKAKENVSFENDPAVPSTEPATSNP